MTDLIDSISDQEDQEDQRMRRVASRADVIFRSFFTALKQRGARDTDRHPQDFGFPNAVWIKPDFDSRKAWVKVQKNIEPKTSLDLEFAINSGAMECKV